MTRALTLPALTRVVFDNWITEEKSRKVDNEGKDQALAILERHSPRFHAWLTQQNDAVRDYIWDAFKGMGDHPEVPSGRDFRAMETRWVFTIKFARDVLGFE